MGHLKRMRRYSRWGRRMAARGKRPMLPSPIGLKARSGCTSLQSSKSSMVVWWIERPRTVQSDAWVEGPDREYDETATARNRVECFVICRINWFNDNWVLYKRVHLLLWYHYIAQFSPNLLLQTIRPTILMSSPLIQDGHLPCWTPQSSHHTLYRCRGRFL